MSRSRSRLVDDLLAGYRERGQPPPLPTFFTRQEWQVVWALAFLATAEGYENAFPLDQYASPGQEQVPTGAADGTEAVRRAVRFLQLGAGLSFRGVTAYPDGRVSASGMIEPRNILYWARDQQGRIACDPPYALRTAARELAGRINVQPLLEAADECEQAARQMEKRGDPEELARHQRVLERSLGEIGVQLTPDPLGPPQPPEAIN